MSGAEALAVALVVAGLHWVPIACLAPERSDDSRSILACLGVAAVVVGLLVLLFASSGSPEPGADDAARAAGAAR